jgi:hypothetical protein
VARARAGVLVILAAAMLPQAAAADPTAQEMADNDYFSHQSQVGAMLWPGLGPDEARDATPPAEASRARCAARTGLGRGAKIRFRSSPSCVDTRERIPRGIARPRRGRGRSAHSQERDGGSDAFSARGGSV